MTGSSNHPTLSLPAEFPGSGGDLGLSVHHGALVQPELPPGGRRRAHELAKEKKRARGRATRGATDLSSWGEGGGGGDVVLRWFGGVVFCRAPEGGARGTAEFHGIGAEF